MDGAHHSGLTVKGLGSGRPLTGQLIKERHVRLIVFVMAFFMIFVSCRNDKKQNPRMTGDADIDAVTEAIDKNPGDAGLYYQRAKKFYEKGSYDLTIHDMMKAMSIDSLNPDYYHLLSDAYLDYMNSNGALKAMNKVISLYPERIPSLLKMSELKYILEDYDGSILTLNEVVRLDKNNAEAYFMLGNNFRALGDRERAINAYQTCIEMDSKLTDAWISLGELHEEKKDPKALTYYESAILSDPSSMQALHAKAYYMQNHGKIKEAQEIYRQIILTDRSYADAYLNSGLLYMEVDSTDRAYEQFDLLTTVAPTNYLGFYYRGMVSKSRGDKERALKDFESAYSLNPKDKKIEEAINSLKPKN